MLIHRQILEDIVDEMNSDSVEVVAVNVWPHVELVCGFRTSHLMMNDASMQELDKTRLADKLPRVKKQAQEKAPPGQRDPDGGD